MGKNVLAEFRRQFELPLGELPRVDHGFSSPR
jgi:hypothetical protein